MKIISNSAKGIIAVIIFSVLLGFLSPWRSSSFAVAVIASVGGMLVLLGLWIEKEADEEQKSGRIYAPDKVKRLALKAEVGWWILMVGIGAEIFLGIGHALKDAWTIRGVESNTSILKQHIAQSMRDEEPWRVRDFSTITESLEKMAGVNVLLINSPDRNASIFADDLAEVFRFARWGCVRLPALPQTIPDGLNFCPVHPFDDKAWEVISLLQKEFSLRGIPSGIEQTYV